MLQLEDGTLVLAVGIFFGRFTSFSMRHKMFSNQLGDGELLLKRFQNILRVTVFVRISAVFHSNLSTKNTVPNLICLFLRHRVCYAARRRFHPNFEREEVTFVAMSNREPQLFRFFYNRNLFPRCSKRALFLARAKF